MYKNKTNSFGLVFLALLTFTSFAFAERPYEVVFSSGDLYFGHISYVDINNDGQDPMIFREGQSVPEPAVLNAPIGPGDVIRTSGIRRCEIQFDTATIVRLDTDTELKIETILAQTLSAGDKTTNLVLAKGQLYIMYKEYNFRELFQVMTPATAIKFSQDTVAMVKAATEGGTEVQVKRGKATALYGPSAAQAKGKRVGKLERLIVSKDGLAQKAAYAADTDFEHWNNEINASFNDLHRGLSFLPKPVRRYSSAIVSWAEKYSTRYGRWIYDKLYGYVWHPDSNTTYPLMNWEPYFYGHWTRAYDQLFWVSDEPWGWVPYHLGIWTWDKELGWLWIPGSVFASAWVGWDFFDGYFSWWPYQFSDWWSWSAWGYDSYHQFMNANIVTPNNTLTKISKAQLKKPESPLPLPKDLKPVYNRFVAALKNQDPRLIASLEQSAKPIVLVHHENPVSAAAWDWKKNIEAAAATQSALRANEPIRKIESLPASTVAPKIRAETVRFLDWNPDLAAVRPYGATVRYSSRTNEVQCPELGLTSRLASVVGRSLFGGDSGLYNAEHSPSSSASSSSGTGTSPVSSDGQSSRSSAGSSSSGSQGHTKKD